MVGSVGFQFLGKGVMKMRRIQRLLVIAILGVVMLGFGFISTADATKAPFMPPDYYFVPGYPDANNANGRIFPGYVLGTLPSPPYPLFNLIDRSQVSFIYQTWVYWIIELDIFPQPIKVQVWVRESGAGDDAWVELKLERHAVGCGHYEEWLYPSWWDIVSGPIYQWYAYFEPYYWDVGEYETHLLYTCKDPDNPGERMVVWDTVSGEYLDYYGMFQVVDG
jgi:hypothetical protein